MASLTLFAIDFEIDLEISTPAAGVDIVADCRAAAGDGMVQSGPNCTNKPMPFLFAQCAGGPLGMDACAEQAFVGVNVADTGNNPAIHNKRLDGLRTPLGLVVQISRGDLATERFRSARLEEMLLFAISVMLYNIMDHAESAGVVKA